MALIHAEELWVTERGMTELNGPLSPSGGDDFQGFLTKGFDAQPSLMNNWNPSWMPALFEEEGYCTETTLLAYDLKLDLADGTPIGFVVGVPDYNQVLADMNGSLFPFGFVRFLADRRKIHRLRVFMQFVAPPFMSSGHQASWFCSVQTEIPPSHWLHPWHSPLSTGYPKPAIPA